jgi:hypothetical protein
MLDKLIQEGEQLKSQFHQGMGLELLSGEDYEKWISKCILFLEKNYSKTSLLTRFLEASKNAAGNDTSHYYAMLGIIKGIKEMEE